MTYRIPFTVSQQKMNTNFIILHEEIIQLKSELHKRSYEYLASKKHYRDLKNIDRSVNEFLFNVINKVSKRNIEALGKVEFSAQINFSADGGLRIAEVENINNIEPIKPDSDFSPNELEIILATMRRTKQKQPITKSLL